VNTVRAKEKLHLLVWDEQLSVVARRHADLMARRNELSHQFPGEPPSMQRILAVGMDISGENVAMDQSIASAHQEFMDSPSHRLHVVDPRFNVIGIGVAHVGETLWLVEDFGERSLPNSEERDASDEIASKIAQARSQTKLSPLHRTPDGRLSELACNMARVGQVNTAKVLKLPNTRAAKAYTADDPAEVPVDALNLQAMSNVHRFEVGSCFARSEEHPSGQYWVLVTVFTK
jgi:hypothetical protein